MKETNRYGKCKRIVLIVLALCLVSSLGNTVWAFYDSGTPVGTLDELTHLTCPRCGEYVSVAVYEPATCTGYGRGFLYCDYCSYGYSGAGTFHYYTTILPNGHSYYSTVLRSATCTEGEQIMYTCSVCGSSYVSEGSALGHDYTVEVVKVVSCTEDGTEKYTCSRCNDTHEETVKALGHDFIYDEKEATCTEDGYKNGKCSRCEETTETVYPALGHTTKGEWKVEKDPGYLWKGIETQVCSVCGENVYREIPRKDPTIPLCIIGGAAVIAVVTAVVLKKRKKTGQITEHN